MNSRFRKLVGSTRRPGIDKSVPRQQPAKNTGSTTILTAAPAASSNSNSSNSTTSNSTTSNSTTSNSTTSNSTTSNNTSSNSTSFNNIGLTKEFDDSSGDIFSRKAVEALLEPAGTPNVTDRGLQPRFTDHALIIMALFQAGVRLTTNHITSWICKVLHGHYYHTNACFLHIDRTVSVRKDLFLQYVNPFGVVYWNLHPELERALQRLGFDPVQHIVRHTHQLSNGNLPGPWNTISSNEAEDIAPNNDSFSSIHYRHYTESPSGGRPGQTASLGKASDDLTKLPQNVRDGDENKQSDGYSRTAERNNQGQLSDIGHDNQKHLNFQDLQEKTLSKVSGDDNKDDVPLSREPEKQLPSSEYEKTDLWLANIGRNLRPSTFQELQPVFANFRDQRYGHQVCFLPAPQNYGMYDPAQRHEARIHAMREFRRKERSRSRSDARRLRDTEKFEQSTRSLLSELPYCDESTLPIFEISQEGTVDASSEPPDCDGLTQQHMEMPQKVNLHHGASEERKRLEPGRGRKQILDARVALSPKAGSLDEEAHTVTYMALLAYVYVPLSFILSLYVEVRLKLTWGFLLSVLCLGASTHFARKLLLSTINRVLSRLAQKSPLASEHDPSAQSVSVTRVVEDVDELVRRYLEPPVPTGMRRARWRCRCGKLIYDDYVERRTDLPDSPAGKDYSHSRNFSKPEGAIDQGHDIGQGLERVSTEDPNDTGTTSSPEQPGKGSSQRSNQRSVGYTTGNTSTLSNNTLKSPPGAGSLPTHSLGTSVIKSTAMSTPRIPGHLEFLLLCIPFKSHANKLLNIDTTTPPTSDVAFFRLLRQTYTKNRGQFRNLFSIRALSEIRFVQFEVFRNDLADVRKYDTIPPTTQKDNYLYAPMPAEDEPPVGTNRMRHLYDYPEHADEYLLDCFSRVPRKLRERLSVAPGKGRDEGWGICFIEGVSWPRVCALGLAGVLASTVFGIVWTVVRDDIQGGFGVASYMLGVLVLGLGALQGAFEM